MIVYSSAALFFSDHSAKVDGFHDDQFMERLTDETVSGC